MGAFDFWTALVSKNSDASFLQGLENMFTGNLDYSRSLETLGLEQNFSALEAKKARDFQQYMAENSHQMEVQDMEKAGLNPYLSLGSGGASSYSAAQASSPNAPTYQSGKGFGVLGGMLKMLVGLSVQNAQELSKMNELSKLNDEKISLANAKLDLQKEMNQINAANLAFKKENANVQHLDRLENIASRNANASSARDLKEQIENAKNEIAIEKINKDHAFKVSKLEFEKMKTHSNGRFVYRKRP